MRRPQLGRPSLGAVGQCRPSLPAPRPLPRARATCPAPLAPGCASTVPSRPCRWPRWCGPGWRCAPAPTPPPSRLLVATHPVDCRKGIDGLCAGCRQRLGEHPLTGAVYVVRHRAGTARHLLCYDGQGAWLCLKRRSQGRCTWWPTTTDARGPLSARALRIVLGNGDPEGAPLARDWRRGAAGEARLLAYAPGRHAAGAAHTSRRCSGHATRDSPAWPPASRPVAIRLVRTLAMSALGVLW